MTDEMLPMLKTELGDVTIKIVNNRTMTPEEWTDLAMDKIIYIAESADPQVKASALAFKQRIWVVIAQYIRKAVEEERAWAKAHPTKED